MRIEQMYTKCLAEAAYYIESKGEAVVIDPLRDIEPYLEKAIAHNAKIKYVFLTHFHADFVSGHIDLAKKTGATIVFGPNAVADFDFHQGTDGEIFKVGDLTLELLHTPGHTMESSTYLLKDVEGVDQCIFTGDALFIGDVGRPDLAVKSDVTEEDLARHLFQSLRNKLMPLADEVIVYPNHGAGSACGKNMSKETFDTLGHQKEVNYALRADMTEDEFVKEVLTGLVAPPQYFPKNVMMNKAINIDIDSILERGSVALDAETFKSMSEHKEALVLDCRSQQEFAKAHVPGSIFIGLDGQFAPWVGALIENIKQPIILVAPFGREEEAVSRLARIGYDNSLGYLKGGMHNWNEAGLEAGRLKSILATEMEADLAKGINLVDVRKESEYLSEHAIDAGNEPLDTLWKNLDAFDKNETYYIHCAGGYRSMIAASILKANGIENVIDVQGGFAAIKDKTDLTLSAYVCPSTLL
jgi:glyoxylase-like metal-dependent hydrolase (beta-lactamase superfamily II)/rhodanese-related sulfurtransferase